MKLVITTKASNNLKNSLSFLKENLDYSSKSIVALRKKLLSEARLLPQNPRIGQFEGLLEHRVYRRIIVGHFKVIYKIENETIYITDFFDSRQRPSKME